MDPEQEIATYLRSKGVQHAVLKDMLEQFAHDLAEAIRKDADGSEGAMVGVALGMRIAADLIDPRVTS